VSVSVESVGKQTLGRPCVALDVTGALTALYDFWNFTSALTFKP